ncbi:2-C-methyl-D-erythritol 4-phosphate cytidylyltransferase [Haloferula chungangensis]|uniref:2-C-methyl-D-erythritol 4-phosphate cytidylyltransferase n=1 Tax=Haloferula chungangensis TaxID=1048331 RepID=A0ABW2L6X4_9BACT
MPCAAIIVASGKSRRMGFDKLAAELKGVSVLRRSVMAFMNAPGIDHVIVVCPQERFDALLTGDFPKPLTRVDGGKERQDSVKAGLMALSARDELVAVHDGARPLVSVEAIELCIIEARQHGAATLARPITETIKKADLDLFSHEGIDRSSLWFTETPQIFKSELLRSAYAHITTHGMVATDEVTAMEALGIGTKLVASPGPNIKITHQADIDLATALIS